MNVKKKYNRTIKACYKTEKLEEMSPINFITPNFPCSYIITADSARTYRVMFLHLARLQRITTITNKRSFF